MGYDDAMRWCSWLLATLLVAGCSFDRRPLPTPQPDAGALDGGMDAPSEDVPTPPDAGELDGGTDAPIDPGMDAPSDAGTDAPLDVPADAPLDAPLDVPADAPLDVPADVPLDVPADVPLDVPADVPLDVPTDVPADVPLDVPLDVPTDVPAAMPDAGPTLRGCNAIYGSVAGYNLCAERATECEFYRSEFLGSDNCTSVCSSRGGVALSCFNNATLTRCTRGSAVNCSDDFSDEICICSRIP